MKKFINKIDNILIESLSGFATAHSDLVSLHLDPNFLTRKNKAQNKVAVISGGGSGHEPLHAGYIGYGMLDAACPGHVFTSPTPDQMLMAAEAVHADKGILFIVKNYAGDVMNFEMAAEMLPFESATVLTSDDCAVINSTYTTGRRGVAGTVIVEKCVGSLAETGADLQTCKALGDKVNNRIASIGIALTSCTVPAAGRPTFDIGDTELEMGVGIHGEPGRRRENMREADELIRDCINAILADFKARDLDPANNSEALLLINGFGATPLMELYLIYNTAAKLFSQHGIQISRSLVGNYTTALDMAGASVTLCLLDNEIKRHWDSPVHTAALRRDR
ncbi:dihydroxyacetone kinase subunit DhaK [Methylotenera sp.]|uniref:dihydroxyacetone kinase subunit DhaK n=1 Tax=Methylotenera sp. TaxID=2051956 RepID=UPI0027318881|nr:dihydroxyacetone kinase subunit DhaK [Methylotenera sp.]MDP2230390.1 dihydroxyacetone kinase subunit DhaK [Methylotenera sp.]MDP3141642.1 dihydroxyacetone kinase subunit DhaK [Methylotenera sp.]